MTGTASPRAEGGPTLLVVGLVYLELYVPAQAPVPDPGEELFVRELGLGVGGAFNTASVAHALGIPTALGFPAPAGPFGGVARDAAARLGIPAHSWPAGTAPPVSVVFSHRGDRALLSSADFDALGECPGLPDSRWVLVPGLREARHLEGQLASVRARGASVCVVGSWVPEELASLPSRSDLPWDLLVLNENEARRATDDPLQGLAGISEIVVTRGERGASALLEGQRLDVPAAPATFVDATGAGDAFCAGLLHARLCGAAPAEALGYAAEVAARVVGIQGGAVHSPDVFDDLEVPC